MARPTIENIRGVADFATVFRWNLNMITFPSAVSGYSSEDLNIRCESVELPKLTNTPIEANLRGHKVSQSGIWNYNNTMTFAFIETVDNKMSGFLKDWRDACWASVTGTGGTKAETESIISIDRLNSVDEVIWTYKLLGVLLEDYDPAGANLDGASSEFVRPSMTIRYDYFQDGPNGSVS